MKAYNGNGLPSGCYTSHDYPHQHLNIPPKAQDSITLVAWNSRTLNPSTEHMHNLLHTTKHYPTAVIMSETHENQQTLKTGKDTWRKLGYTLKAKPKHATANEAAGVAIAHGAHIAGIHIIKSDPQGRYLAIQMNMKYGQELLLIAVYGPQRTQEKQQQKMVEDILALIQTATNKQQHILLIGDWNANINYKLDSNSPPKNEYGTPWLQQLLQNPYQTLTDPWRYHNPKTKAYTYTHTTGSFQDRKDFLPSQQETATPNKLANAQPLAETSGP
jgi:exonuclease III